LSGKGKKTNLPRAIAFVATLASIGIPPSIIGTGRGLKTLLKEGMSEKLLNRYLPTFESDLNRIGAYLNWENLKFLIKKDPAWEPVREDVLFLEKFLGHRMGPQTSEEYIHRNLTSNIYHLWTGGKKSEVTDAVLQAARVRKSLG
jgi:phosphoenolpyruvate carboxylase